MLRGSNNVMLWLLPALGAMVGLGLTGIFMKLALKTVEWQQLVMWVPICYAVFAVAFAGFHGTRFPTGMGSVWALLAAVCASSALVLLMLALSHGSSGSVVPVTAIYPGVTVIVAAIFLAEGINWAKALGTALVIVGAIVIGRWGG